MGLEERSCFDQGACETQVLGDVSKDTSNWYEGPFLKGPDKYSCAPAFLCRLWWSSSELHKRDNSTSIRIDRTRIPDVGASFEDMMG